ncbi:MAG TPA: hypothetical protein VEX41_11685, partial [Candidatus Eisenbacteria bacterium]|nr:hypothetical protein [Candidatus Eisenbacteria bacterium]
MTSVPRAVLAVDAGAATTAAALLGRPADRWRLIGALAAPASGAADDVAAVLADRVIGVDPGLAAAIGLTVDGVRDLPRLETRSFPPSTLAVLGASRRAVGLVEAIAARTSWRVRSASPDSHDPREMTELALRSDVSAILIGTSEPPGPDERGALDDLAALTATVARRRPELRVVLAGPIASRPAWTAAIGDALGLGPQRVFEAPALSARGETDDALREILEGLLPHVLDTRHAAVRSLISLADALDRRIELLDIGFDGGLRAIATPGVADDGPSAIVVRSSAAALVPPEPDATTVEEVLSWTTGSLDRHRMGDRLQDLRSQPWGDPAGDGARVRLAATRAALARLVAESRDLSRLPAPDITIVSGGGFALAPPAAIALAVADVVRRTGATQLAFDHARLLGPLGTIEDPDERRGLVADLADDLLAPIGSLVVVGGLPAARRGAAAVGSLALGGGNGATRHELFAGDVLFVDLAPGDTARASLEFSDAARVGRRAHRMSVPVTGGLAGVLVDLRDVPLRLPERR